MELSRQRTLHELMEFCRKRTKETIESFKKNTKWYWPELHLYFGICKLSTGIYIRSAFYLLFYIVSTIINILMVYLIIDKGRFIFIMDIGILEDYFNANLTDENYVQAKKVYTLIIIYLIVWCVFKIVYIMSLLFTIYALYKKKPKILKIVLFNNTLNWILNILLSFFATVLTQLLSKSLLVVGILLEGYNLLALSSEYKQLKGKSKLVMNLTNAVSNVGDASTLTINVTNQAEGPPQRRNVPRHCETCSCSLEPVLPNNTEAQSAAAASTTAQSSSAEEEKQLNIKDIEIIFNQDQLLEHSSSVIETNRTTERPTRPRDIDLPPYGSEKEKEISDIPVIYDENQLQVGGSPIIES